MSFPPHIHPSTWTISIQFNCVTLTLLKKLFEIRADGFYDKNFTIGMNRIKSMPLFKLKPNKLMFEWFLFVNFYPWFIIIESDNWKGCYLDFWFLFNC